jgi:hypothetical protein
VKGRIFFQKPLSLFPSKNIFFSGCLGNISLITQLPQPQVCSTKRNSVGTTKLYYWQVYTSNSFPNYIPVTHYETELLPEIKKQLQIESSISFVLGGSDGALANLGCAALHAAMLQ